MCNEGEGNPRDDMSVSPMMFGLQRRRDKQAPTTTSSSGRQAGGGG